MNPVPLICKGIYDDGFEIHRGQEYQDDMEVEARMIMNLKVNKCTWQ